MPYANPDDYKKCQKEYRSAHRVEAKVYKSEWDYKNKNKLEGYNQKWDENVRQVNHRNVLAYFETHPCVDCGESDPVVLQFDHVDRTKKEQLVSRLIDASYWENVLEEIAKCEVRCANCHTRRTAIQCGWWKAKGA